MTKQKMLRALSLFLLIISVLLLLVACDVQSSSGNGQPVPTNAPSITDTPSIPLENTVTFSYTLPIIPITFSIDNLGQISISLGIKIVTPLGEINIKASSTVKDTPVPANSLLLVIRHKIKHNQGSSLVDSSYRIDEGQGVGSADIKGHITEVKLGWNGKNNSIFIDASNGDIKSIVIEGAATTPTTTVLTPSPTLTPTAVSKQENLTVDFKKNTTCYSVNTDVKTANSYQRVITLTVSGTGQARGNQQSDAFYIFTDEQQKPITPIHVDKIGAILFINNLPADNFINGSLPSYNPNHTYTFTITTPGGKLAFSVGDCNPNNNTGHYKITISSGG